MAKGRKPSKSKEKSVNEGNLYDKILKENAEEVFLPLVEERLGIKIKSFRPLKEKIQTTLEREMDFFYIIVTQEGKKFILHLEFQTEDDWDILYRKGEYHGIALRKFKMEIRHLVIFLGDKTPTMPTKLLENEIYRGFELINVHAYDVQKMLNSEEPRVVIMAILADYPKEQTEAILRFIFMKLKALSKNQAELSKFIKQAIVLSRLRKIDGLTIKISEEMPITYDISQDYLYNKGIEKGEILGIEKGKSIFVENLIINTDFDDTKIASLSDVTIDFVKKIRHQLQNADKKKSKK
jgi:hypothetical protein